MEALKAGKREKMSLCIYQFPSSLSSHSLSFLAAVHLQRCTPTIPRVFPLLTKLIDIPGFFQGCGQTDPLECRNFFSGGKVGGPGGK